MNVADDGKSRLLIGLCPKIIMECVERAMSFWDYQIVTEMFRAPTGTIVSWAGADSSPSQWNEHLGRMLESRIKSMCASLESKVSAAETEINGLHAELDGEPFFEAHWYRVSPNQTGRS